MVRIETGDIVLLEALESLEGWSKQQIIWHPEMT